MQHGDESYNSAAHISICTSTVKSRNQGSGYRSRYLEDRVLIAHPFPHKLCASCSRNTCTTAKIRAEIHHNLLARLPLEEAVSLLIESRLPKCYIRQILPVEFLSRGEMDWCVFP